VAKTQIKYLDPVIVSKLKNIEIKARMIVEGFITGLHKSPYHGFSVEFAEHRPYNTGESLKNIDWKVFAKSDKLYTKKFEEETNMRCYLVMDTSDSMRYPVATERLSKLEYGAYLMAALGYLMVKQRDAVGLALYDDSLYEYIPPKAKYTWLLPIFHKLETVIARKEYFTHKTATAAILHQLANKLHRRGFIALITDMFANRHSIEELFPALQHLRHSKHEVIIFHLLDTETEEKFNFPNQPLILKDLETGAELKVQPDQVKEQYQKLMAQYLDRIKRKCRELNIEYNPIDIKSPYDKALTDYLIKRKTLVK
jgi:uncharacterized protein (DUF58 family)